MLNSIRNSLKYTKWVLLLVIASFVLFFGTSWWEGCGRTGGGDWVASVNGQIVRQAEWRQIARFLDSQYRQRLGDNYDLIRGQIDPSIQAREQLIDELLIVGEAQRLGLDVADSELVDRIRQHPAFQGAGGFVGGDEYKRRVMQGAVPPFRQVDEFEDYLRRQLMFLKWQSLIASSIPLTEEDIAAEFVRRNESVDMDYVSLSIDEYLPEGEPDDSRLQAWYSQNADDYATGEARRGLFLLIDDAAVADRVEVPERDIERYYEQNAERYARPEERKARHILVSVEPDADAPSVDAARSKAETLAGRAKSGEDFAAMAIAESDDKGSGALGGDLGFFARGRMVPEFENAVFEMSPGDVSDPIRSTFGFHVILLQEIREEGRRDLEEVREQIASQLRFPLLREASTELAESLVEKLEAGTDVTALAEETGLELRDTGLVSAGASIPGLGPAPELVDALFGIDEGETTGIIALPLGNVVATLDAIVDDHVPPLSSIRPRVVRDYNSEIARTEATRIVTEAMRTHGDDLESIATALSSEVETVQDWLRGTGLAGVSVDPAFERAIFTAPVNRIDGPIDATRSVVVAKVTYRKSAEMSQLDGQRSEIEITLKEPLVLDIVQKRIASLREGARIERNEAIFQQ